MSNEISKHHKQRLRAEIRFKRYGMAALGFSLAVLVFLMGSLFANGLPGFIKTKIMLPIHFDVAAIIPENADIASVPPSAFNKLMQQALRRTFPDAQDSDGRALYGLISGGAGAEIKKILLKNPGVLSTTQDVSFVAASKADLFFKGQISERTPEADRKLSDKQVGWLKKLQADGRISKSFNTTLFSAGDSRTPERAGFLGAMVGSAFTLIVCILVVFPIGVATAVYLEEFARKGLFVDIIEVNINNLAAVPSIVFGLLGLAVYINVMGMPRSASLVGGMTLALMILPVIIIATRAALKAIPDSIRDAARALGASPLQVVWHHTLPLSMPGVMTGTILGMARAIGETAPLLMIGMVAFVADIPSGFTSPATVMPVQIYLWASSPEAGFAEKTAAAILVLLTLLLAMNALAIYLRKRLEVRW